MKSNFVLHHVNHTSIYRYTTRRRLFAYWKNAKTYACGTDPPTAWSGHVTPLTSNQAHVLLPLALNLNMKNPLVI